MFIQKPSIREAGFVFTYLPKGKEQTTSTKHKCQFSNSNNADWNTRRN